MRPALLSAADAADRRSRLIVSVTVVAASLMAFIFMRPDKIFLANTPSGGDMGAHVVIPAYLRDTLLPSGRVLGWSNDWYAGFPMLYFYFPLPAFAVVLLDLLLPYGVAFKLVTVAGLVALPGASYYFARNMGFARPVALVGGMAGATFMFMETFSIFGGNTLSTLAGEYSFSWSFALCLVYLGMVMRNTREGRGFTVGPAVVLALAALSHVITTAVAVVASLAAAAAPQGPPGGGGDLGTGLRRRRLLGGAVPDPVPCALMTDMGWTPRDDWTDIFPRDTWPVLVLGAAGLAWAVARRALVGPAVDPAGAGHRRVLGDRLDRLHHALQRAAAAVLLLLLYLFAGLFVGLALMEVVRRLRASEARRLGGGRGRRGPVPGDRRGGSAQDPGLGAVELHRVRGQGGLRRVPGDPRGGGPPSAGARHVGVQLRPEPVRHPDGPDAPALLEPGAPSMEGLLFESSLTTPFHFLMQSETSFRPSSPVSGLRYHSLDLERAVPHLALYDVAYYISFTEEGAAAAAEYGLEQLAETPPFKVFALPESSLVDVATYEPAVWAGEEPFFDAALDWFDDVHPPRTAGWWPTGRPTGRGSRSIEPGDARERIPSSGEVSDVVLEAHRISFHTTAVGVPHLVKVSYFPNWQATGAEGPYRAAPSLMVVVPTSEDVVIEFRNTCRSTPGCSSRRRAWPPPALCSSSGGGAAAAPRGAAVIAYVSVVLQPRGHRPDGQAGPDRGGQHRSSTSRCSTSSSACRCRSSGG